MFEAYFPDTGTTRRLLPRLEQAFKRGLTFTVVEKETRAKVTWSSIPHKTTLQGGKSGCVKPLGMSLLISESHIHTGRCDKRLLLVSFRSAYPDSSYLDRLAEILTSHGIEESPAKCK